MTYEVKLDIKEDYIFKRVLGDSDDNPMLTLFSISKYCFK